MPTSKQQREAARRHLERQLARRQARQARRRRMTMISSVVGALVAVAVVIVAVVMLTNDNKDTNANPTPSDSPSAKTDGKPKLATTIKTATVATDTAKPDASTTTCQFAASDQAAKPNKAPAAKVPTSGKVTLNIDTNQGAMTFVLDRAKAPCTVASFVSLASQKYFNNTSCHRLVTSSIYVLQCGDPSGSGMGGPGYGVPDEATGNETYPAGTIAMARTQSPNSGGSQFFIVFKDSPNLQQQLGKLQYTVFGTVTKGLPVVNKIAAGGVSDS